MKLERARFKSKPNNYFKRAAVDVLHDKMVFYESRGTDLFVALKKELKDNGAARGDLLVALSKQIIHCNDMAVECAHKLAPYQNAKLQSIEVKKKVTHKFVIQAPKPSQDPEHWLQLAEQTKLLPAPEKIS